MTDTWSTARWLQHHPALARLLHRVPFIRRWLSARVWHEALAAGRVVLWEDGA